jgi:transcriptional regulator with XRE-family HTH domain
MSEGFKQTGELIKKVRKEKRFTQAELAGMVEVSQGFIADLENGKMTNPNRQKLYQIAKILEIGFNEVWDAISYDEFVLFDQETRGARVKDVTEEYSVNNITDLSAPETKLIICFRALSDTAKQAVLNLITNLEALEKTKNEQSSGVSQWQEKDI